MALDVALDVVVVVGARHLVPLALFLAPLVVPDVALHVVVALVLPESLALFLARCVLLVK
jgi:hypothetical protein